MTVHFDLVVEAISINWGAVAGRCWTQFEVPPRASTTVRRHLWLYERMISSGGFRWLIPDRRIAGPSRTWDSLILSTSDGP